MVRIAIGVPEAFIEGLYFGLGLAISGLAAYLWMIEHRLHHLQIKHT
jgi:hypothetical protein